MASSENPMSSPTFTVKQAVRSSSKPKGAHGLVRCYSRLGLPISEELLDSAREQRGSVTNTPTANDGEYVIPVTIGGQLLQLDLDTGSSDLWVYSSLTPPTRGRASNAVYDPAKSPMSKLLEGLTYSLTYGDGSSSSGLVYADTVCLGGVEVYQQAVQTASRVSSDFYNDEAIDGMLGLGLDTGNQVLPTKQKTFFSNARPHLVAPLFTAYLNHGVPGSYDFGFIDQFKLKHPIAWVSALTTQGKGWWGVLCSGYSFGLDSALRPLALHAIIDSGDTYLMLPPTICDAYFAHVPLAIHDQRHGWLFPLGSALPAIRLALGKYMATIPGELLDGGPVDGAMRYSNLQPIEQREGIPNAVFGDIFLKSTFTIFKWPIGELPQLGFVAKPPCG